MFIGTLTTPRCGADGEAKFNVAQGLGMAAVFLHCPRLNALTCTATAVLSLCRYGSYEYPYNPSFGRDQLSLLDRGWTVAIAHIRGGGELLWMGSTAHLTIKHIEVCSLRDSQIITLSCIMYNQQL